MRPLWRRVLRFSKLFRQLISVAAALLLAAPAFAAQSLAQILDKFLNIMPTVTIREGHRVKIYLSGDLALPDYNNHKLPSDL